MNLKILFYTSKRKSDNIDNAVILCRLSYNKKRKQFSTGLFINPDYWNSKKQKVEPCEDSTYFNQQLSLIKNKLNQAFLFLQVQGESFTVHDIYLKYKGETTSKEKGVIETYKEYCDRISKLVGKDIQEVTYKKYLESGRHLQDFIKHKFKVSDTQIKAVKASLLEDYEYFLNTEKNMAQSTLNKAIQRFRRVVKYAISQEYLGKDPFILYKPKSVKKPIVFLDKRELELLETKVFEIDRLNRVKDLFVFCCYTGLGFTEMINLRKDHIKPDGEGNLWVHIDRKKTYRNYQIPLLPQAKEILDKYQDAHQVYALPRMCNQPFNAYLKESAALCGIKKHLTHHVARKTFATTILLYNDVPIEVVSKLLGHRKLQTTQDHYGEILHQRLLKEVDKVKKLLN